MEGFWDILGVSAKRQVELVIPFNDLVNKLMDNNQVMTVDVIKEVAKIPNLTDIERLAVMWKIAEYMFVTCKIIDYTKFPEQTLCPN